MAGPPAFMMPERQRPLAALQAEIAAVDTRSLPLSGLLLWSIAAAAGLLLPPTTFAYAILWGSALLFPAGILVSRLRGLNMLAGRSNPLTALLVQATVLIVALWPIAIIGAPGRPVLVVLFAAVASGLLWIPWGWAAADPVGLRHAIGRAAGCYAAYFLVPSPYTGSAICVVVMIAYVYSLRFMGHVRP